MAKYFYIYKVGYRVIEADNDVDAQVKANKTEEITIATPGEIVVELRKFKRVKNTYYKDLIKVENE